MAKNCLSQIANCRSWESVMTSSMIYLISGPNLVVSYLVSPRFSLFLVNAVFLLQLTCNDKDGLLWDDKQIWNDNTPLCTSASMCGYLMLSWKMIWNFDEYFLITLCSTHWLSFVCPNEWSCAICADGSKFRLTHETSFVKGHNSFWTKNPVLFALVRYT